MKNALLEANHDVEELFRSSCPGWQVRILEEVDSTMNAARRMIEDSELLSPSCIMAQSQSGGRGRQGRRWSSSKGGFYVTYVLNATGRTDQLAGFSLAVGAIIAQELEVHNVSISLKWPNDLMSPDGKKVGGILIETFPRAAQTLMLIGIGMNFDNQIDLDSMSSVRQLGAGTLTLSEWGAQCAAALERGYEEFCARGLGDFLARWLERDFLRDKIVEIDCGERTVQGVARGVSSGGALLLETADGSTEIWSGHIIDIRS